jgi:Arc/MetJ-type ribon-helix-helix transcriptional regulator
MTIHLPEELQRFVQAEVSLGHFASEEEAITQAVRLLRQRAQELQTQARPLTEEQWQQQLLQSGLLSRIPVRPAADAPREFQPVKIEGEPLSETIIRERR